MVSVVGLNNIVVVNTDDALFISDKEKCQDVKYIVDDLKKNNRLEILIHNEVYRPWGGIIVWMVMITAAQK